MTTANKIAIVLAAIAISLASLWYGQNNGLLPVAVSEEASRVDRLFSLMMTVATGLFLLIEGVVIYSAIAFRRRKGDDTDGPPIEGNIPLEIVWTAIPTVIVLIISVYSFEIYNSMGGLDPNTSPDPGPQQVAQEPSLSQRLLAMNPLNRYLALGLGASPDEAAQPVEPLTIEVNAIQYAFLFTYPDTGVISGEMHVPAGRPVDLRITAGDVIHAFWLPELRIKQDAIPGRETRLQFTAKRLGDYPVVCAELCGAYHGAMNTRLYVESEEDFDRWMQEQQGFASADLLEGAVAGNGIEQTTQEYLAPFVGDIETDEALQHLHAHHQAH